MLLREWVREAMRRLDPNPLADLPDSALLLLSIAGKGKKISKWIRKTFSMNNKITLPF